MGNDWGYQFKIENISMILLRFAFLAIREATIKNQCCFSGYNWENYTNMDL
ncbi:unnamed protein product [Paramecium octaurelia]|uniref:Uncharacterized protein n=1 Tax=Paramecium octaurelia TaxID=43137 RepID=A0A8S1VXG6_PAROT|nr:unnamed protein product [Paramecium octaurelia]